MNQKIKNTITFLIIIAIIIGIYFIVNNKKNNEPREEEQVKESELQEEIIIKELTEKYDALANWEDDFFYTFQLQELLINSNRPVLFKNYYIDDILEKNNRYYIHFDSFFSSTDIYLELEINFEDLLEITNIELKSDTESNFGWLFGNYIIIADIDSIKKPRLQIEGYTDIEDVILEYDSTDIFIATGKLIDFVYFEEE